MDPEMVRLVIGFSKGFGMVQNVRREHADFFMDGYRYAALYEKAGLLMRLLMSTRRKPRINFILFDQMKKPIVVIDFSEVCFASIEKKDPDDQDREEDLLREIHDDVTRGEKWRKGMGD